MQKIVKEFFGRRGSKGGWYRMTEVGARECCYFLYFKEVG